MDKDLILDPRFNWTESSTNLLDLVESKYSDQISSGVVRVTPKDWKVTGQTVGGLTLLTVDRDSRKSFPLVVAPHNAPKSTLVHEVAHRRSRLEDSSKDWYMNLESTVKEELDAEMSVYSTKGKTPTYRIVDPAMHSAVRKGYKKAEIMGAIIRYFEKEGYGPIPTKDRSWIWNRLDYWYKKYSKVRY